MTKINTLGLVVMNFAFVAGVIVFGARLAATFSFGYFPVNGLLEIYILLIIVGAVGYLLWKHNNVPAKT
jgi:hypothetical protein